MVLNGILVFFLGLTGFLFLQYDTFYARQNPKPLINLLKEQSLAAGLEAIKTLPPLRDSSPALDPRSFFSFLQSGPPAETTLYAIFQSQFEGKETVEQAVTRFESLDERDQLQCIRLVFLISDRSQYTIAYPTLLLLISEKLIHNADSQIIDLILALRTPQLQALLTEKFLTIADVTQTNRLLARIESSSLSDETKSELKKVFTTKRGVTQ